MTTSSSDQFALELDQVKSLFEDSPQLALQLYICFKSETHFAQKIAIIFSSLSLAVPNVRALRVIKKSWIDYNFFSLKKTGGKFEENWESRQKSLKSIAKHVAVYSLFFAMFVFVSFTRAASIAIICCFLSYNAILVYVATFLALKILFELAKLAMEHDALKKFSKERLGDIVANVFNILELRHDSFVTICYAVLWMIFNVTTIGSIMAYEKYGIVSSDDEILLHLWIAPSFELTDWSEMFIRKQGLHVQFMICLCILNMLSCICLVTYSINKPKEEAYDVLPTENDNVLNENFEELATETEGKVLAEDKSEIWAPYESAKHFESVQNSKLDAGLSTMTQLMDPWDFVSEYANKVLERKGLQKIDHFEYEDAQQLLLKTMNEFHQFMHENPMFVEVFRRCRSQYDFLEKLEKERIKEKSKEFEDRFEELEGNSATAEKSIGFKVVPFKLKDKSTTHEEVSYHTTSEKENNIQLSSLQKSLAEKEEELKGQTGKIAALEEELSALKTELVGLKSSQAAPVVPFKPKECLPYKPISALLEVLKALCLHMRIIGLGVRDIKKNFRIIEVGEEGWVWVDDEEEAEATQKKEFESLFKVLFKQIAEYGKATVPDIEQVVQNVTKVFVVFENQTDETQLMETLDNLKSDVKRFKTEADKVTVKQEGVMKALVNTDVNVVKSLGKFNDVTDCYKKEMETLEKDSENETLSKKILEAWKLISLGISVDVAKEAREESQSSLEKSELLMKAEEIRKMNEVRENIAITTKAVIIPSFKKYMLCVRGLAKFVSVLSEDLDKVNAEEADVKEFFDTLQLGSADVKETCTQFIAAMSEVRTDLGVIN